MSVAIVYNPVAGRGRARSFAERLRAVLERDGARVEPLESRPADPAQWLAPRLGGVRRLIVVGGDGAVRQVACACADSGIPIWHAPTGTENLFARAHGMSADPEAIRRALRQDRTRALDLGCVGSSCFAIMASAGFDADVVHELAATRTGAITHASYIAPILRVLSAWRPPEWSWLIDGEHERLGRGMVVVANMREYGVRLDPARWALADDGLLDAVFIPAERGWDLLPWIPLLRLGLHGRHPSLRVRRAARVELYASAPFRLQLDGDPHRNDPHAGRPPGVAHRTRGDACVARFSVRPGALTILQPAESARG